MRMGRKTILAGFWLLGFSIGFIGYLIYPGLVDFLMHALPSLFTDKVVVGAFLSGIAGSIITTVSVVLWSYLSR